MQNYGTKKTYLDLFLENSIPKKREKYFLKEQEDAIIAYNKSENQAEKNKLFAEIIDECFKKTVGGVLEMPKFRHLPKALNREELIEQTYFRLIEKINKFEEGMISSKTGLPVKAFSYFSTVAKNYILEQIKKHNKVLDHKADVESSIDLTILSEETLTKISKNNIFNDIMLGDQKTNFSNSKILVIQLIKNLIIEEESKEKRDEDFIKLGYCLKYLLEKWPKFDFEKKNEFMRILTLYTGFNQQKVSFLFKSYKIAVIKQIKPNAINKKKIKLQEQLNEEFLEEVEIDDPDRILTEEEKLMSYNIHSMDEFENREYKIQNIKKRDEWRKISQTK